MKLAGCTCLVTGASSGLGRAVAGELAARGLRPIVNGRDLRRTKAAALETGGRSLVADLADVDGLAEVCAAVRDVDLLVLNAGVGSATPFAEIAPGRISELVAVNLTAPMALAREALPGMLARGRGRIVLVGSIAGHVGVRGEAVYSATKGGLVTFAESLQQELRGSPVGVTLVSPGVVETPFFERRERPYERGRPRPVSGEKVAKAIVRAVERDMDRVIVPGWLALPVWLHGVAPNLYRAAASRWG
ncbi:MAG: SDR family NAD(P)-dependent oxidoreductase [Gaiella sp.]